MHKLHEALSAFPVFLESKRVIDNVFANVTVMTPSTQPWGWMATRQNQW